MAPIPWNTIIQYAEHYGLEADVAAAFVIIMQMMDAGYIKHHSQQNKTKAPKPPPEAKRVKHKV